MDPKVVEYGVGGGLCYLLLKLILDFLQTYLTSQKVKKVEGVEKKEWEKFLEVFDEHHAEDKQLFRTMDSLEKAIRDQTAAFIKITAILESQQNVLNQMHMDIRGRNNFQGPKS